MKKSILCVSFFLFLGFCSSAQTWLWGAQGYTVQDVEGWPVAADNNGNAFLAGYYRDSIAFGAYSLTTTTSNVNCYLAKYDSSGNVQWAKQANSTSAFCMNTAVAADLFGNSYISGQFNGIISFDTDTLTTAPGQYDYFFVKYDIKGNVLWAQQASAAQGNSIASDNSGNIYVTGQFSGTPTFGNTTLNNNTNGDAFIVKYNTKGSAVWAKQSFSGTVSGSVVGNSVAVDVQRNVFITGSFHNTISFGTYVLTGTSQYNVFIVKYDSSGNVLWAEQSSSGNVSNNYVGYSIVADSYDDSYITGIFQGQISFGNYNLNSPNGDAFLVKYDPNGKVIWAKQSSGGVAGYSLAIDKFNNLYFSGGTDSLVTFCNHTFSIKSSYISDASLLMKIDTGGNALCGIISAGGGGMIEMESPVLLMESAFILAEI
ncbi:MAG TPA: SBBP repeat-containing protein [Bacteroidia bacterium]|jgi:hypothetical protein|nr:SBBP repeat-containing protein [Bacteroidia bacterium]